MLGKKTCYPIETPTPLLVVSFFKRRARATIFWPNLIDGRKFHRRIMSGKYRAGRSPEGVTEGADAMSYYNALQFTARYKLATMCPALSFSVNPFAAAHAAPPFENDYRPEKSQWRNWSQCPCRRRSSHSCIHSPHSSLSGGCSLESQLITVFHFQVMTQVC